MGVKIERADVVRYKLTNLKHLARRKKQMSYVVGYTMSYAVHVHENMTAHHAAGKQAKYLEGPARQHREELREIARTTYAAAKDLNKAVAGAATRLYGASQELVPVDTGALRLSGFVAEESKAKSAAALAQRKAEAHRRQVLKIRQRLARQKRGKR